MGNGLGGVVQGEVHAHSPCLKRSAERRRGRDSVATPARACTVFAAGTVEWRGSELSGLSRRDAHSPCLKRGAKLAMNQMCLCLSANR
jgi:hypothetical protein